MKRAVMIVAGSLFLAAAGASAQDVNDAQIASIVVTANQVDITAGRLAAVKSHNPEVKKFAELMVTDHTGVLKAATDLVRKLQVAPQDNPTSQKLKTDGQKNITELRKMTAEKFDKTYLDREVAYHQAVLEAVDKTLIPNAKNEELKALLVKVRPAFGAHLEHAKKVQASLGKSQ